MTAQRRDRRLNRGVRSLAVGLLAVGLAGCGTGGSPDTDDGAGKSSSNLYERSITLTDGRAITCIVYSSGYRGGLSCDWDSR